MNAKHLTATSKYTGAFEAICPSIYTTQRIQKKSTGEAWNHIEQINRVIPHHRKHPAAEQGKHDENHYHLRQKRERLLLNRSRRLKNRDDETDNESRAKNWSTKHYYAEDSALHQIYNSTDCHISNLRTKKIKARQKQKAAASISPSRQQERKA